MNKRVPVAIVLWFLFGALSVSATEEYADLTGKGCGFCHLDSSGGGELTPAGRDYLKHLTLSTEDSEAVGPAADSRGLGHYVRLAVGYIHFLFAVFWFGTILYVHVVLKPAYAAHGLPPAEVRVGLLSMAVMAVTGIFLTVWRVPSLDFLTRTRFGILLLIKIGLFLVMAATALYAVTVLGPKLRVSLQEFKEPAGKDLTASELGRFDGREGRRAYIAASGTVYDVGASPWWSQGRHFSRHQAGEDLTDRLADAPHGEEKLRGFPEVGALRSADLPPPRPRHERIFFALAYFNLAMVCFIVLILALWRWW